MNGNDFAFNRKIFMIDFYGFGNFKRKREEDDKSGSTVARNGSFRKKCYTYK